MRRATSRKRCSSGCWRSLPVGVAGELTLALRAVSVRTVLQSVADSLALTYTQGRAGDVIVGCVVSGGEEARFDFEAVDMPLPQVLSVLGDASAAVVDSEACGDVRVDLRVTHASPRTVLHEIVAQAGATLDTAGGRSVVRCGG